MHTLLGKHWHHLPPDEILQLLESDLQNGLDLFEVRHRQQHFGPNLLTPKKGKSPLVRFLLQFHNPLLYILLASSVITALIKDPLDAAIIFAVVLINAIIGYVQESKAEKAIEALAQAMTTEAVVVRAGHTQRIPAAELAPGDIVQLQAGSKVPADLRLLRARDLQIAEAALTGESLPVQKAVDVVLPPETVLAERRNMAYASTLVTFGQGTGIVTAVGDGTEVGRISQLISEAQDLETPLTRKIAQFSRLILYAILALAAVTFGVGILRGQAAVDTFTAAVALAVAMIPEGLPAALTVTLAIGVSRMARRRAIIRKLPAVETLGSVTVICSDKTGTLTQNQMTVQQIVIGAASYQVSGVGYAPSGQILYQGQSAQLTAGLRECLQAGVLCNDSALVEKEGQWQAQGDPTEVALIVAARKAGPASGELAGQLPRLDVIPFDSQYQYMATLHAPASGEKIAYVKGAVEALVARCTAALDENGQAVPLQADAVYNAVEDMANRGLRVLAFAKAKLPDDATTITHEAIASGLTLLGLQGMIDPPRQQAISAVRACQDAGVDVKMITGDHALTAAAIAVQIGLAKPCPDSSPSQECVLSGKSIAEYSDEQLVEAVENIAVFARVSPEQKLRLVEALQAKGNVVAMTGDGVNDGPALKQSDIGIAMGITGTDVAKEAADMILTDDNFATIEAAVEEGRSVFDNLTKIIAWTLPTNLGEGMIVLLAVLAGLRLPILPIHILWINTITAGILSLVLAVELKEPGIMQRPPRAPDAPILTRELLWRIVLVGILIMAGSFGLYELGLSLGVKIEQARTIAVNAVVMIEIFYLFNCRSLTQSMFQIGAFSNKWMVASVLTMLALQLLFTYAPFMNSLLASAPISLRDWGLVLAVGLASYAIVELEKWLRRLRRF
ncbi:MAG: cation-transporting P-type ATPase [Thermoflexales bacterium]|nr:cation-transporting P-type ATPase [Thermoflexales bacterium]